MTFDPSKIKGSAFFGGGAPAAQAATPAATAPSAPVTVDAQAEPVEAAQAALSQSSPPPAQQAKPAAVVVHQAAPSQSSSPSTALMKASPASGLPMTLEIDGGGTLDIAAWVENDPGMGDLDQLKAPLPVVSAAYSQSKIVEEMGLKEGLWTHQATGEQTDALDLVVINVLARRDLRAKYESGKDEQLPIICEATDGRHGEGSERFDAEVMSGRPYVTLADGETMQDKIFDIEGGRPCKDCPFSQWRDTKSGRKPPLCRETYNVVGDDPVLGPIVVPFRGKGIKPLTRWRTAWWLKVGRLQAQFKAQTGRHLPATLFASTRITLVKEKTYYVPVFGAVEPTPKDRLLVILQNHAVYGGVVEMLGSHDAQQVIAEATSFDPAGMED